jgi:hypothetical protein
LLSGNYERNREDSRGQRFHNQLIGPDSSGPYGPAKASALDDHRSGAQKREAEFGTSLEMDTGRFAFG